MVNFLAELPKRAAYNASPTPSNGITEPKFGGRGRNIYELDAASLPEDSYWLAWGGYDDAALINTGWVELYYGRFLMPVESMADLEKAPFCCFSAGGFIYINVPSHPWIFGGSSTGAEDARPYLSAPLDESDPAELKINGKIAQTRLALPNFTVKLSESASGAALRQGFSLSFANSDGYFDAEPPSFNAPVTVKKSTADRPAYSDFKTIRRGLIGSTLNDFSDMSVEATDFLGSMDDPVCGLISESTFNYEIDDSAVGKAVPVIYGVKKTGLIKLGGGRILLAEYALLAGLYDGGGNELPFSFISRSPAVAQASEEDYGKADYAVVTGYGNNTVGRVIIDLIHRKTPFYFLPSFWNISEANAYAERSPRINIAFTGGGVSKAASDALKSDMAYLIQQADGKLTLRKWGAAYAERRLEARHLTQPPSIDYSKAQENYFSRCVISHNGAAIPSVDKINFIFDKNEEKAELLYRKTKERLFETDLIDAGDAERFAALLGGRYTFLKPSVKIAVGIDASGFELLDAVFIKLEVNGRRFTEYEKYIITEINHAQDALTIEATD